MMKELVLKNIDSLIILIKEHCGNYPAHLYNCDFLVNEFLKLKSALVNNSEDLKNLIEWSVWFAPRIIYDGINNKEALRKLEELNELLKKYV
ncbi:MAG: hypothetical protein JNK50_10025 [Bacteroidia bacterium]|nr:hypothetical protein [Bacteroidia bacterium]